MYPPMAQRDSSAALKSNGYPDMANGANASSRTTVQSTLDEQEKSLSGLHETINLLEQRLCMVLGPPSPQPGGGSAPAPVPSTLLSRVELHNRVVHLETNRLHELINRLEV